MVEAGAKEVSEADMLRAHSHRVTRRSRSWLLSRSSIVAEIGKEKRVFPVADDGRRRKGCRSRGLLRPSCAWAFEAFDRHERSAREEQVKQEAHEHCMPSSFEGRLNEVGDALYRLNKEVMRTQDSWTRAFARTAAA